MRKEFEVHMLNDYGKHSAAGIADNFDYLLDFLEPLMYDSRCAAIVRAKLEEACFFAKKAMASNKENQVEV